MKDVLVSYEVALLAKEKGFSKPCYNYYHKNLEGTLCHSYDEEPDDYNSEPWVEHYVSVPAQAALQKYLRMKYHLHIIIGVDNKEKWAFEVSTFKDTGFCGFSTNRYTFPTYELALDAALIHALNLIK